MGFWDQINRSIEANRNREFLHRELLMHRLLSLVADAARLRDRGNHREALPRWQEAYVLASSVDGLDQDTEMLLEIVGAHEALGQLDNALEACEQGAKRARKEVDIVRLYNRMGIILSRQGKDDLALTCLLAAAKRYYRRRDRALECQVCKNVGIVSERLGEYAQARSFYLKALKLARRLGDAEHTAELERFITDLPDVG